jgi:hypothetical protein
MRYNRENLIEYCKNNDIALLQSYDNVKRESFIEGKCIFDECKNTFCKNFRQLVKTGAYCGSCITKIASIKIHNSKVKYDINVLDKFCNENTILLVNDYSNKLVNRDTIIEGICNNYNCENIFSKPFRQLLKINGYCENCSKENGKIKILETNIKKYGVGHFMKLQEFKDKQKQTMTNKYGVEHNSQLESIKLQKREKSIEKYGTEYPLQNNEIRNKIKQTNLQKYGVENPQQNTDIQNKTYATNMIKYGCKIVLNNVDIKKKIIQTNLEKYGVSHHSQNAEIAEYMLHCSYNKKNYTLPSGKVITYQGYENFALDELLFVEKINENDIITDRKLVPEIWYNDTNNKKHRHYVDIYIKSQNRCVEVKSTWTNQEKNCVLEKKDVAIGLGYKYDIWIYDKKKNKTEL